MSPLRFNHVFAILMLGAFLCAFMVPTGVTDRLRLQISGMFIPVSAPSRWIARSFHNRFAHRESDDKRPREDVAAENDELRQEVVRLRTDVDRLEKLEAEQRKLGNLQQLSTRVQVAGSDSAGRDSLILAGGSLTGLKPNAPAFYVGGLAGRVFVGGGGARVTLLTDAGFSVTGSFIRFVNTDAGLVPTKIPTPPPLVEGLGHGQLAIRWMKKTDYDQAKLYAGDWVVLDDPEWPHAVQGLRLGRLMSASESRTAPGYVEIKLEPETDLMRLSDVFVLTKE